MQKDNKPFITAHTEDYCMDYYWMKTIIQSDLSLDEFIQICYVNNLYNSEPNQCTHYTVQLTTTFCTVIIHNNQPKQ